MNGLKFTVPENKHIRVIIDTDAACEADDPFAIAHALMSPKLDVVGIVAEHFNETGSMMRSFEEIKKITDAMKKNVPAFFGEIGPLPANITDMNPDNVNVSDGVDFIIKEAMNIDDRPLYILCQGAITNVAAAFIKNPYIIHLVTVVWIGTHGQGPVTAPFREFNAGNDITAANIVLTSGTDLWLIPSNVYTTINIGIAEIQRRIYPCGEIGKHLFENMVEYNNSEKAAWTKGESWSLGDSPAVAVTLNPDCGLYVMEHAPKVMDDTSSVYDETRPVIRIYKYVDARYLLEDFIAKLELCYGE